MANRQRGQPKKFKKEVFSDLVLKYFKELWSKQDAGESDMPTLFGLYLWLSQTYDVSFRTVRRCLGEYWPDIKNDFENMRADTLVRGAANGLYNVTAVIFALKNWCRWADKPVDDNDDKMNRIGDNIEKLTNIISRQTPDRRIEDYESDSSAVK